MAAMINYPLTDEYLQYFDSIKKELPAKLVKYYEEGYSLDEHNYFHDCIVKKIEFNNNENFYKNEEDSIKLTLSLDGAIEYNLNFKNIGLIETKFNNRNNFYRDQLFGEIIHCKLGLTDEKNYLIEFDTSTGFEFKLEFKKVDVKKLKLI